ncbi:hypothetical protein [Micromonospora sp. NPDC048843]
MLALVDQHAAAVRDSLDGAPGRRFTRIG